MGAPRDCSGFLTGWWLSSKSITPRGKERRLPALEGLAQTRNAAHPVAFCRAVKEATASRGGDGNPTFQQECQRILGPRSHIATPLALLFSLLISFGTAASFLGGLQMAPSMPGSARQWATTPVGSDMHGSQGQTLTSESTLQMRKLIRTKITEVGFVPPSPRFVPRPRPLSPVPLGSVTLQASTASSQT